MNEYPYLSPARIKELYREIGDAAIRKRWGQNFLIDANHIRKIADQFLLEGEKPGKVFEIGPGLGALTWTLSQMGFSLSALEIDPVLVDLLKKIPGDVFEIFSGDVRRILPPNPDDVPGDLAAARNRLEECDVVGGNLPYYISSEIITGLVGLGRWRRGVFLLQTEFARRAAARNSESSLSVFLSNFGEWHVSHHVPPNVFYPVPGVGSSVLVVDRFASPRVDPNTLEKILRISFRGKRKKLGNAWKMGETGDLNLEVLEKLAGEAGFDLSLRPDQIDPEFYFKLVATIQDRSE